MLFNWRDRRTWKPLIRLAGLPPARRRNGVLAALRREYSGLRAFHGTRTSDVSSFYRNGLLLADNRKLANQARELLRPFASDDLGLESAISKAYAGSTTDEGRAYVALDATLLINSAGHYLIYGSEFVIAAAVELGGEFGDLKPQLCEIGRPTVFRIALSPELVRPCFWHELARAVSEELDSVCDGNAPSELDFTIILHKVVPPNAILSHWHPTRIRDPLRKDLVYKYDEANHPQ